MEVDNVKYGTVVFRRLDWVFNQKVVGCSQNIVS